MHPSRNFRARRLGRPAFRFALSLCLAAPAAGAAGPASTPEPPPARAVASSADADLPPVVLRALRRLRRQLRHQAYADVWRKVCGEPAAACSTFLVVTIARQRLELFTAGRFRASWPVSTSRYGIGQRAGSDRTPTGLFRVIGIVGRGGPAHQALDDAGPTGRLADPVLTSDDWAASQVILGRILLLEGLQPGWNRGGDVDTQARDIFIHGTANVGMLGTPASDGCVQMAPSAVVALARVVPVGALVLITSGHGDPRRIPGPPVAKPIAGTE
jgi:hypothetical protein